MSHGYKFYIQRVEKSASGTLSAVESTTKDLEAFYEGLKYSKLTGINDIGKTKNIYTEKYPEGDRVRVYIPELAQYESTTMTLTLYFFGKDRQTVFADFANEIKTGIHRYWDTARYCYFDFYVDDELKISDESWYKGEPYFKVEVKMKNLYGKCTSRFYTNLLVDGNKISNNNSYVLGQYYLGDIRPADGDMVKLSFSGYLSVTNADNKIKGYDKFRVFNSEGYLPLVNTIDNTNYNSAKQRYEVEFAWKINGADGYVAPNDSIIIYQATANNKAQTLTEEEIAEGYRLGMSQVYDVKLEIQRTSYEIKRGNTETPA